MEDNLIEITEDFLRKKFEFGLIRLYDESLNMKVYKKD